jgi:type I restriction enzyme S subunit
LGLLQLPEDWVWAETKEVAELISGQHILKEDYNFNHSGLPYLTGPADFGSEHPIVTKSTTKPKVIAKDGDVLVTVKGAGVGKVNILNVKEAAISRQLMAIRTSYIIPKFVFYYIRYIFDQIQKLGSGSTVPGIRRENLLELPIPLSSVAEQKKIIEEIESRMQVIDETEKTVEQSLKQAELLRQNILKRAFEGKLVPQDQTEEPAEKLLERIKEEKAKRETKADNKTDPKGQGLMQHVK